MKHIGKRLFSLLLAVALLLGMFPTALIPLTSAALPAGDETIVSTLRVESIVDGSAPFDGDDKPGNDSNEHNKIVRSFDSVTYDFDVEVASVDPEDSFTEAYVRMEFTLPVSKDQAEFDTAAMAWMESTGSHAFQVTDNGSSQTLVVYKHLTDDGKVVVPGSFGHNLTIQVKGMSNGSTIQPTIKASMEGNAASAEKSLTPAGVTVSAAPRFNIKIDGNSDYKDDFDFTTDGPNKDISSTKLPGRMMNLGVSVELYNNARDKAFKGVELPTGDIQFKLKLSSSFLINKSTNDAHSAGETIDAAAAGYTPLLWSIDGNEISDYYGAPNGDGRVLYNTHGAVVNAAPYNSGGGENACYNGGSWSAQQLTDENGNPTGELLVTVSGYQIDINQMPIVDGDHTSDLNAYGKDKGIGVFSAGEIWVVQPFNYLNSETQPDGNSENYDIVRDYGEGAFTTSAEVTELNVTTVGGTLCDTQQDDTDDIYKCGLELVLPGSLQNRVYYASLENTSSQGVNVSTQRFGDDTATPGTEFYLRSGFTYQAEGEEANRIHWGTNLLRFPADVFDLMGEIKDDYLFGAQGMNRTTYYAAKPDGTDWKDYEEMKTTTEGGLEFYTSLEELEGAGKKCVGILHFFSGTGPLNGMEPYYGALVRAKVAEDAKPNTTVSIISTSRVWTQSMWIAGGSLEDPDLTKGKIEISNQYTDPKGETKYLNSGNYPGGTYYIPAFYDENNVLTPHNSDWGHWGDTMRIIGYKSTLTLSEAQKVNGQEKETYTLERSQREVDFVIQPAVNFDKNSSDGSIKKKTDLKITATLPKYLSFVEASSYWGGTYTQSSANGGVQGSVSNGTALAPVVTRNDLTGETTLTWELHDVVVGEAVSPIYFTAYIGSKSPDSDCPQGTTPLTVQATICGTEDNRAYIASNGNLASQGITVTKGRANSFTKYVKADTVEADGNVDYVIYSSNNATTEEAVYLMDTMPWDGQNGSSFSGSYHVSAWKLDTELCDASKLTVYYTLDSQYSGASTTSVSKDAVTSAWTKAIIGSDGTLTDMNNLRPTAWAIVGALDAAKAINIDLQIKLEPDYTNFRSQALYVNTISSGTLRSTASASVVQRSISGYAWSDDDGDGTKLDVADTASDRCAGTTFYSQGTSGDAILYLEALKNQGLQTADLKELKVVMSGSPSSDDPIKLYFRTDGKQWAEGSRFEINNPTLAWKAGEKLSEAEKEYVFDLSSSTNANWTGELTEMRLDPLQGTGLYFNIKSITLVKAEGSEILMDFCTKGAYENYVRLSGDVNPNPSYPSVEDITLPQEALLSGKAAGSCFTVSDDTTKGDLYFELKDTMTYGLSTLDIRAIRFTASAQAPEGQEFAPARPITLYYATGSKTAYSENADQVLYLEEYIRQEEATYTFDLSNKSGWNGKINAIRIDPLEGVNYKVTLKSIMLDLADGTTRTFDFTVPGAWETYLKVNHSTGAPELVDTTDGVVRDSVKVSLYRKGETGGTTFSTGSNPDAILGFNDVMFRGLKTQDVSAVRVVMSGDSLSINPPQLFYKSSNPNANGYSGSRMISLGNTRLKKDMQEFVFPLTGASGWDSGYDVTGFRLDPLQYENSSFTIRTIIIELTDGSRRVFNFTEPDAYKALVSTANLLDTVTYSDTADSYVPVTNAGNLPVSAYLGQSVSAKAPGAVTETTSGHYEFRDLPGGTYMVRMESGTTDLSQFDKTTNAVSVYDANGKLIAAELRDIKIPSTTENYAADSNDIGFYGKSTVVLNYDRKVAVDPVSFRAEAPSIALAEACDATNWSDTLEKTDSKGRTVTFAQVTDGKVVITPYDLIYSKDQPSASLFYRLSYTDGTSIIREISIKPADIIYYEESNDNLMTFTDGQRGSWIKVTGQYDHNAAGDAADYDQNADNQYQDADTGTDDYDSQYSGNGDNLYFSAGTARMVNVTADVKDASKTSPFPTLQFSFYGTGFDLVSMGTPYGGVVNVQVYAGKLEDGKKPIYTEAVNTRYGIYYGDHDGGSETRPSEGREVDRLYQGTALLKDDLEYGMYTVVCTPMYSSYFDPYDVGSFDILVDGVRILNPLGETPEYQRTAFNEILTSSVSLFITEYGKTELCDKLEHGPKYEIHLAPQQSIAVSVTAKAGATLRVGAQSFSGTASKLSVYSVSDFKSDASTSPIYEQALNVATEMHYPVRTWAKDETQILLFKNTGEAPIALTSFEYVAGKVTELKCDPDDTQAALDLANALLLPEDPSKDTGSLAISAATLLLSSDIGINFYVPEENLKGVTDPYMVITKEIYDWRGNVSRIEEKKVTAYTVKDGRRVYTFDGISASEMGSLVTATMHGTDSTGKDVSGTSVPYSVKTYAMNQLASTTDEKLKTLLVDMLNYGAAAQEYWGYHTQQPVNGDLTADQQSYATQENPTLEDSTQVSNSGSILFSSASLVLKDRVAIKYYLRPDGYTGKISDLTLKISYTDKNGETQTDSITGDKFTTYTKDGKTYYAVVFDSLNPAQMRNVCTAQVFDKDGNQVSGQLTYSIESYATRTLRSGTDEKLNTLVNNMMKYGDSTARYFGLPTKAVRKARQAYEICYTYSMDQAKNLEGITSGWQVDNRAGLGKTSNADNGRLSDISTEEHSRLLRYFNNETAGSFDFRFALSYHSGFAGNVMRLAAEDGSDTFYLITQDDGFYVKAKDGSLTALPATLEAVGNDLGNMLLRVIVDLDKGTSRIEIDGIDCGTHPLLGTSFRCLSFETTDESTNSTTLQGGYVEANYAIYENFTVPTRAIPTSFTNDNALSLVGEYLRLAAGKETASSFEPLSGNVCFTLSTKPERNDQSTNWSLCAGDDAVVKLELKDGYLYANGQKIMKTNAGGALSETQEQLQSNMWHLLRIEADMTTQKAIIKVHTSKVATVDFLTKTSYVDGICVDNTASAGCVDLDDIMVYNLVDYDIPEPQVVEDGYNIGINVCSLWENGSHWGWATITPHDDLKPVLGYYDENLTETADWEIKYMAEHGIDFQAFCWFASSSYEPLTPSAKHLDRAFVNAKYSDKMKFCLLWEAANGSVPSTVDAFKNYYVPYIIENYFTNPSYMTIDGKPVLAIFGASRLKSQFGNDAATVKGMFDYLREEAKKVGFKGVIVLDCNGGETNIKDYGFDGWYAYNWSTNYTLQEDINNNLNKQKTVDAYTVPTISVGFNHVGWAQERFPLMSVSDFKAANEWVRDTYIPTYANTSNSDEDRWQEKFAMISTWNEYGEGTYIMPSEGLHGFQYLDVLREVYSGGGAHTDVKPTDEQKALITHNYPQDIRVLRQNGDYTGAQARSVKTYTTDFYQSTANLTVKGNGVYQTYPVGQSQDAIFSIKEETFKDMDASQLLRVRVKASGIPKGAFMQLFYGTDKSGGISEGNSIRVYSTTDGEQEFVFELSSRSTWVGTVTAMRLDPVDANDVTFTIESVTFEYGGDYPAVYINGMKLDNKIQTETQNGVDYVPFEPGVSRINHLVSLYFEWSYETKTLTLYRNKHSYQFVTGKDYALVDGKTQVALGGTVYQQDNIPMLPIEGLAKVLGLHCVKDGIDYRISTQEASNFDTEADGIWTFNRSGDARGWTLAGGTMNFTDDTLVIEGTKTANNTYDPRLSIENLNLDCSKYTKIEVCVKWDITGSRNSDVMKIYYTTTEAKGLSEGKSVQIPIGRSSNGEFKTFTFDMTKDKDNTGSWKGYVTQLRFDPFDDAGTTEIKYIRFVEAKEESVLIEDDAEGTARFRIEPSYVKIVDEPADYTVYNKCYYVYNDDVQGQHWPTAHCQNVNYEAGKTYQIDFDVKIADSTIPDSGVILCNAVYKDPNSANTNNHIFARKTISKNDGWVHYTATYTVNQITADGTVNEFTIYSDPTNGKTVNFYFDNVKVTVVDNASVQSAASNLDANTFTGGTGVVYSAALPAPKTFAASFLKSFQDK